MPLSGFVYLLDTFSSVYSVTGDGKKSIQIKTDLAKALLTFQLKEGQNKIFVQYFYDCHPRLIEGNSNASWGSADCDSSKDSEVIEYLASVSYEEKNLEGFQEIVPTAKDCQAPAK